MTSTENFNQPWNTDVQITDAPKKINPVRKQNAFICISIGAFIGFLSCVLAITNPLPNLFNFFLYGLTMLAICIILPGFYLLFEG